MQSTVANRCIRTFPNSHNSNGLSDRIRTGLTSDPRLTVDDIESGGKRHGIAARAAAAGGQVAWVYRHLPLIDQHVYAEQHAEAAECAASLGGQSMFWLMVFLSMCLPALRPPVHAELKQEAA